MFCSRCLAVASALLTLSTLALTQPVRYFSRANIFPAGEYAATVRPAAAFDSQGYGYVAGAIAPIDEDDKPDTDFYLTRFDPAGNALWSARYEMNHKDVQAGPIFIAPDGGALVAVGSSDGSEGRGSFGWDVLKFSSAGTLQWDHHVGPNFLGMSTDPDGTIYILGTEFTEQIGLAERLSPSGQVTARKYLDFDLGITALASAVGDGQGGFWAAGRRARPEGASSDLLLVHFSAAGELDKTVFRTGGEGLAGNQIARDAAGNLYVAGTGERGIAVAKFNSAGDRLWVASHQEGLGTFGLALKLDPSDNPVVAGEAFVDDFNDFQRDVVTVKFSSDGELVFSKRFGGSAIPSGDDFFRDLLIDPIGNVYTLIQARNGDTDYAIVKYLPDGDLAWPNLGSGSSQGAIEFDETESDLPAGLGFDSQGFLYVGGKLSSTFGTGFFGAHHVLKFGPASNAAFISQSVPTVMVAGQTYPVSITFKNTGMTPWSANEGFYLRSSNPTGNLTWGRSRVEFASSDNVVSGDSKTFSFHVYAPRAAGTYNFEWKLTNGEEGIGLPSPTLPIKIIVREHAARYVNQVVPTTVKAGSDFTVQVRMRNVGTKTWSGAGGFRLVSWEPGFNTKFGAAIIPLRASETVAPGQEKVFTFTCVAPSTPGTYTMFWRMHRQTSWFTGFFGDATMKRTITVTP